MLGAIAGDIIGTPFEHCPIKTTSFPLFCDDSCFSDDTVLTLAVADWLMSDIDHSHQGLVSSFRTIGRRYIGAGYGSKFYNWLRAESVQPPYGAYSNGCAMRVSPVGLYAESLEEALELAKISAEVTHNHPDGIKGAQAIAACVYLCKKGRRKKEIKEYIERHFGYNLGRTIAEIRQRYQFDVTCNGSVPEAIIAFLEGNSFEEVIRLAVSLGGDSDTLAAMAGSIAACLFDIPPEISEKCNEILTSDLVDIKDEFIVFTNIKSKKLKEHCSKARFKHLLNSSFLDGHKFAYYKRQLAYIDRQRINIVASNHKSSIQLPRNAISICNSGTGICALTNEGQIYNIQSNEVRQIPSDSKFMSIAYGCFNMLFGLDIFGKVHVLSDIENDSIVKLEHCGQDEGLYDRREIATSLCTLDDVVQICAGPRHVVCLLAKGTVIAYGKPSACMPLSEWKNIRKIYVTQCSDYWGKYNDLTFGISEKEFFVAGDCWNKAREYWNEIRSQHYVTDVIEDGCSVLIRFCDGTTKFIMYYDVMNYIVQKQLFEKQYRYAFMEGGVSAIMKEDYFHNYEVDVKWE